MKKFLILSVFFISFSKANTFIRSPKSFLLGGAFTARATEDFSLFYNPALLGRHKGLSVHPLNFSISLPYVPDDIDKFNDLPEEPADIVAEFLNYPLYLNYSFVPGIKFGNFAFNFLYNLELNTTIYNDVHPFLDVDYTYDQGFIFGYAHNLKKSSNSTLSVGLATKYIRREGIRNQFSIISTDLLNSLESGDDFRDVVKSLGLGNDKSWGFDFGLDYQNKMLGGTLSLGLSIQNIFDLKFLDESNPQNLNTREKMQMNFGSSYSLDLDFLDVNFSLDIQGFNQKKSLNDIIMLGAEFDLPLIDIFLGHNKAGISYGLGLDLFLFELVAGVYSSTIGTAQYSQDVRRAVIYLKLLDFSFDG